MHEILRSKVPGAAASVCCRKGHCEELLPSGDHPRVTAKALGKPMDLVVYPSADHDFIAGPNYRAADADDAWRRTTDALHQAFADPTAAH